MKRYFCLVFAVLLITAQTRAENTQTQRILQNVIDKLNLTSFANSVRPRREDNKVTFKDYELTGVKIDGEKAIIRNPDIHRNLSYRYRSAARWSW